MMFYFYYFRPIQSINQSINQFVSILAARGSDS